MRICLKSHPLIQFFLFAQLLLAFTPVGFHLQQRLGSRPEWLIIVIGYLAMLFSINGAAFCYVENAGYPRGQIWIMFGVVPALAQLLFFGGLEFSARNEIRSGLGYYLGLALSAIGVSLAIALRMSPIKKSEIQQDSAPGGGVDNRRR